MPLWQLIPSALQLGSSIYQGLNKPSKPKYDDYRNKETEDALNRQIRRLETNAESQSVARTMARPAIRRSALEREQARREILGSDLSPTARTAAGLQLSQQTQGNVSDIMDKANIAQLQSNLQGQRQMSDAEIRLAQLKDAARLQYQRDLNQYNQQYGNDLTGKQRLIAGALGGLGGAFIDKPQVMQGLGNIMSQYTDMRDQDQIQGIMNQYMGQLPPNASPEEINNALNLIKLALLQS